MFYLTIDLNLRCSSSCATILLRLPFLPRCSVVSSPLMTPFITSLSKSTLRAYAWIAPCGSSFVESSLTASRASSSALDKARRGEGLWGLEPPSLISGGDKWRRSRLGSLDGTWGGDWGGGLRGSKDRGGESERLPETGVCGEIELAAKRAWENWVTAVNWEEAVGLWKELRLNTGGSESMEEWYPSSCSRADDV